MGSYSTLIQGPASALIDNQEAAVRAGLLHTASNVAATMRSRRRIAP
jgi:hypothetical protein